MAAVTCFQLRSLFFEHVHKQAANDLAFGFRLTHAGQLAQEQLFSLDANDMRMQLADKHVHDHVAFIQAQQAVIDKHTGEFVANGAVNQGCGHRRVHAARQPKDDFFITHLRTDLGHGFFDVVAHDPVRAGLADVQHEAIEQGLTLHGVRDFRVKLHRVKAARFVGHAGDRASRGRGHDLEAFGQLGHFVAVAHPDLEHAVAFGRSKVFNAFEQFGVAVGAHFGIAKFAGVPGFNLAAQLLRHGLHAVANAQHRNAEFKHGVGCAVVHLVHAGVRA